MTLVGKVDGENLVPLPKEYYTPFNSKPLAGDVVEVAGEIRAYTTPVIFRVVTDRFAKLVGWEIPDPPLTREDVL